jgi:hypothetical protein
MIKPVRLAFVLAPLVVGVFFASSVPSPAATKKNQTPISCALIRCATGFHCVDTTTGGLCVPNLTCASVRCAFGTHCVDSASGPSCVPNLTCASVRCRSGFHCADTPTGPSCVPNRVTFPPG